jgi:hypothetical protein
MARTKAGAGAQPPRKEPDTPTVEGVQHLHYDDDGNPTDDHLHRLGHMRHLHLEDGKVEFADGRPAEQIATDPPTGPGIDESGMVPGVGYVEATGPVPDPRPGGHHADTFNGEAERKDAERRAAVIASVTAQDIADRDRIGAEHKDIIRAGDPLPRRDAQPPTRPRIDSADVREQVIGGALSSILRPAQQEYALTHAKQATWVMELAGVVGDMWAANGNGELIDAADIHKANRLVRKLAISGEVDLLAEGVGS